MKRGSFSRMITGLLLGALLVTGLPQTASAEVFEGDPGWRVAFTSEKEMDSNFTTANLDEAISGLQPGDTAILTLQLRNENETATDWYMTNDVLYSLEDRSANGGTSGGAYTYYLSYTNAAGEETVLFDSDTVGGDDVSEAGEGLHEATDALGEFFFLDTLSQGQGGRIRLEVSLDGETQGNDYQDTLADLQMNFAVELNENPDTTTPTKVERERRPNRDVVQTGDQTKPLLYTLVMGVSGLVLLLAALYLRREDRKEGGSRT